ncbi:prepilin-type N-terminal cleavage/methylation domain-containing protein [Candidatus Sumerlaeota bacterium]|nr:prepilin-type N-terminal cleavage/methylation domain-containing protein [Candidatus Sumerlaeota bacterium]
MRASIKAARAPQRRRRGFTLIELLIVVLVISIIGGSAYQMAYNIEELGDRMQTRIDVAQAQSWVRQNWRAEVELASRIGLAGDADELRLTRRDANGRELQRRYRLDDQQRLICETWLDGQFQPMRTRIIDSRAEKLAFSQEGRLVKISWTALRFDGRQTWRWPSHCEAAALFADAAEGGRNQ